MADKGWIKTYRKIQDCWIWLDKEPFDKRSAWIDLLLTANHADKKILFNGELITIERGQILTSIRQLADKWKWSYDKVLRFLRLIESDGMIKKESDNFRTLLTIENYELYQDVPNADRTQISEQTSEPSSEQASEQASERTSERVSDKQELKNNKNDKELKNEENDKNTDIYCLAEKRKEVVDYLNMVLGTRYKPSTKSTKTHIDARLKEGYSVDDFKTVIDKKAKEWLGTDMERYLRPETLFGTKFEGYLNQTIVDKPSKQQKQGTKWS